ncbi:MAG: hypothetical protein HFI44_08370 [Lachnospiraceae bacterium]|nr:hypothetical protein [Lachnospiraceae bacterium]GFI03824.1 hypothetical protein IMSAGC005_02666 [Lachnospiraceae bacterium]
MEVNGINLFYAGIAYGTYPAGDGRTGHHKIKKEGLPIHKMRREFPYLLGGSRGTGKIQIYYALLPEYRKKGCFSGKPKNWKSESVRQLLEEADRKASLTLDCREQVWATELDNQYRQIPIELTAALLYRQRPFDKICITLSADSGEYELSQVIELIGPYLPRTRQVLFKGEENPAYEALEDYLYEEFGILAARTDMPPAEVPWLDMEEGGAAFLAGTASGFHEKHICRLEILKFLDTSVKNGYNTEVN